MFLTGIFLLVLLYLVACHARWLIARHFGQPWRLLDPIMLLDSWDHMRCSGNCWRWRTLVLSWLVLAIGLIMLGV